jgi:tRNA(Ile)-lysidine synthase
LILKVKTYIETNDLLVREKPVIVGFSGGSDSISLLYTLNYLGFNCISAHCNFHLREQESDRDEIFCESFARKLKVEFLKSDFDIVAYSKKQHLSIEMAARELRYEWFEAIRKEYDAQAIAIAHHKDDCIETVLLNLIRGTGIRGLCGIKPKNGFIVRPLICVSRSEIDNFIKEQGLQFVKDSSNDSIEFKRNFVRHRLIPLMKELNPSVNEALIRMSKHIADVETIYLNAIESIKNKLVTQINDSEIHINIKKLQHQPAAKTILYEIVQPYGFNREVSENIYASLNGIAGKQFFTSNSKYKLLKDRENLIIYDSKKANIEEYELTENRKDWENLPIKLSVEKISIDATYKIEKKQTTGTFDYDKLRFPLVLRKWKQGDWFVPFGMSGNKKLSDYFTDNKININDKEKIWVLCSEDDIIWVVGRRTDNRFRIDKATKSVFIINFFENKK